MFPLIVDGRLKYYVWSKYTERYVQHYCPTKFSLPSRFVLICFVEAGRLVCLHDLQSSTGKGLVLLAGLTKLGRSAGEGSDKTTLWIAKMEVRHRANDPVL